MEISPFFPAEPNNIEDLKPGKHLLLFLEGFPLSLSLTGMLLE
jgi:hypothetical protein